MILDVSWIWTAYSQFYICILSIYVYTIYNSPVLTNEYLYAIYRSIVCVTCFLHDLYLPSLVLHYNVIQISLMVILAAFQKQIAL